MGLNYIRLLLICLFSAGYACAPVFSGESTSVLESDLTPVEEEAKVLLVQQPLTVAAVGRSEASDSEPMFSINRFLTFPAHVGPINALVVNALGNKAYSGGQDGTVVMFEAVQNGNQLVYERRTLLEGNRPILALSLSQNGERLAIAQYSSVTIYDLIGGQIVGRMTRVLGRILALAWDPRGESLAFGRANGDVYIWNLREGWYAGEDNDNALEAYQGATSPIIGLQFHPSGRAFFAAERSGGVVLWRLLRTERELGLRDENAEIDRRKIGRRLVRVAQFPGQIEAIWLSEYGEEVFVSAQDGNIYIWKVRGLRPSVPLTIGPDAAMALVGGLLPIQGGEKLAPTLITAGRGQRVKLWCREPLKLHEKKPADVLVVPEDYLLGDPLPAEVSEEQLHPVGPPSSAVLVAQSPLFRDPVTQLAVGVTSPLIWAAQQGGAVLVLDAGLLGSRPVIEERLASCSG